MSDIFTLVQLNFWRGRLYYPLCNFFDRVKPDILVAQEVWSGSDTGKVDHITAEMLVDEKRPYFDDFALGPSYDEWATTTFGGAKRTEHCATFSKKPYQIIAKKIIPIHRLPEDDPEQNKGQGYLNILETVIKLKDGQQIHILNRHGNLVKGKRLGSDFTDHCFQQTADYIKALTGPVIFSGDLNLYKESSSLKFLQDIGLKNLNDTYNISSGGRNEFSWKPEELVSHIFVSDHLQVDEYYLADDNVSDHKALVMTARLK